MTTESNGSTSGQVPSTEKASGPPEKTRRGPIPWLTLLVGTISLAVYVGIQSAGPEPTWEVLSSWGAPSANEVWNGAYWGLLTSVFVHLELWHLAFNLYWLWILGGTLERRIGRLRWLLFFVASSLVSSGAELALSGSTGIGLSGAVYALFGYLWVERRHSPELQRTIPRQTILLMLAWLVGCMVATAAGIWQVANAAHISGLLFGAAAALSLRRERARIFARGTMGGLLALSVLVLFWCPWSLEWVAHKGLEAHDRGDYQDAIHWYRRALRFDRERAWTMHNLALASFSAGKESDYQETLRQLRKIDPASAAEVEASVAGQPARSK